MHIYYLFTSVHGCSTFVCLVLFTDFSLCTWINVSCPKRVRNETKNVLLCIVAVNMHYASAIMLVTNKKHLL